MSFIKIYRCSELKHQKSKKLFLDKIKTNERKIHTKNFDISKIEKNVQTFCFDPICFLTRIFQFEGVFQFFDNIWGLKLFDALVLSNQYYF